MHRIDEKLQKLDAHLECAGDERASVEKEIKAFWELQKLFKEEDLPFKHPPNKGLKALNPPFEAPFGPT